MPELTEDEIMQHTLAIGAADNEDQFVVAFAAYVRDVIERETDPYEKIALFVHEMIEGSRELIIELGKRLGGGKA